MYPRKDIKRIPILPFYSKTRPFMLTCACFSLHVDSKQANSIFIPDKKNRENLAKQTTLTNKIRAFTFSDHI